MNADNFQLADYLKRIGMTSAPPVTSEGLATMMQHQLRQVPFENLDVQAGKVVSLKAEDIVEKIVRQRRGGYCYEINGLFCMALQALGFPYFWVAARPMFYPARRPKTHMAIVVQAQGRQWLCDLGFGSYGLTEPLPLDSIGRQITQGHDKFMLSGGGTQELLLQAWVDGSWLNQYSFDLHPQEWIDFEPANYLNSTHPEAVFVKALLVIQHFEGGRHILFGDSLKTIRAGLVEKRILAAQEMDEVLQTHFQLIRPSKPSPPL